MSQFYNYFTNKLILLLLIIAVNSCALSNSKYVAVHIYTNPAEAQIYIDGKQYRAKTSTIINLEPSKDYRISLKKDGYDDIDFTLKAQSLLRSKHYERGSQSRRCLFDKLTLLPLLFRAYPSYAVRCDDFKKSKYNINLVKNEQIKKQSESKKNITYQEYRKLGLFPQPLTIPPRNYYPYKKANTVLKSGW